MFLSRDTATRRHRRWSTAIAGTALILTACSATSVTSRPLDAEQRSALPTSPSTAPVPPTSLAAEQPTAPSISTPSSAQPLQLPTTVPATTTTTSTAPTVPSVDQPITPVGQTSGAETARAQQRLLDLGFWLAQAGGDYDTTTQQAVMAFQKYHRLTADGILGPQTADALNVATRRPTASADAGTLIEVDKGFQLLFIVIDGRTEWVLNASTGTEVPYEEPDKNTPGEVQRGDAVTRNGLHIVYRERAEGWWEGDLGEIYRPKYFDGGLAVHGSNNVPGYPASHGCVRVSVPAMDWIWATSLMPVDTPVWVHEGNV